MLLARMAYNERSGRNQCLAQGHSWPWVNGKRFLLWGQSMSPSTYTMVSPATERPSYPKRHHDFDMWAGFSDTSVTAVTTVAMRMIQKDDMQSYCQQKKSDVRSDVCDSVSVCARLTDLWQCLMYLSWWWWHACHSQVALMTCQEEGSVWTSRSLLSQRFSTYPIKWKTASLGCLAVSLYIRNSLCRIHRWIEKHLKLTISLHSVVQHFHFLYQQVQGVLFEAYSK